MENLLFLGVPILKHIRVNDLSCPLAEPFNQILKVYQNMLYSLSYSTALVPNAGSNHVYLEGVFIR